MVEAIAGSITLRNTVQGRAPMDTATVTSGGPGAGAEMAASTESKMVNSR